MGRTYYGDDKKLKAYYGNKKVLSMWYGSIRVYPNAGEVTYYVDSGVVYTEEIDIDNSCLTPTTFTPTKSGWTFVGWREDSTASSSVLSEKISDGNNYMLYAVFKQNVTVTKYNGSSSATAESKTRYYNNTNVANPSFTLSQNNLSGWSALGWCDVNSATASVVVNNGGSVTLAANKTYYGKYSQTITLSYNGNGATGGSTASQSGTRYFNSLSYSNPSFSLRSNGFTRTSYSFTKWAMGSTSGTQYSAGASVTLSANTTFYALWQIVYTTSTATHDGAGIRVGADNARGIGDGSYGGIYSAPDTVNTRSITGNAISWNYSNNRGTIKANCACTVSVACSFVTDCVDGWTWYTYKAKLYKNGSEYSTIWDGGEMGGNGQGGKSYSNTVSVSLNAGETCDVMLYGGHDQDTGDRTQWYWTVKYTATPR